MILTEELVKKALGILAPSAEVVLGLPDTTWGPKWVDGWVLGPGLEQPLPFRFGQWTKWDPSWGAKEDFILLAEQKSLIAEREKMSTSLVIATRPWVLREGEHLYPGGVHEDGISVGVSGAKGLADEGLAWMLLKTIKMLCLLETEWRIKQEQMTI